MNDMALALLADDPAAQRPTREAALRAALAVVRAEAPRDGAGYIAIVRDHLRGCAHDDDIRLALRDLGEAFDLLVPVHAGTYWATTEGATPPPGLYSVAAGIVALERAIDEQAVTPVDDHGEYVDEGRDDERWRARFRAVRRELANAAAARVYVRVDAHTLHRSNAAVLGVL